MKVIETPAQKRKRLLMQRAWKVYNVYKDNKSVFRIVADSIGISYNTAKYWISKLKNEYEQ